MTEENQSPPQKTFWEKVQKCAVVLSVILAPISTTTLIYFGFHDRLFQKQKEPSIIRLNPNDPTSPIFIHPENPTHNYDVAQEYFYHLNYGKALEYFKKALDEQIAKSGLSHLDVAKIQNSLGIIHNRLENYDEAIDSYIHALVIYENHSKTKKEVAYIYSNLGFMYLAKKNYIPALRCFKEDLAINKKVLGEKHPDTISSYDSIGLVYYAQDKYELALKWYDKAWVIRKTVLGEKHPDTIPSYNNIGNVYRYQKKYELAIEWYEKAEYIWKILLDKDSSLLDYDYVRFRMVHTYVGIGAVHEARKDFERALKYYEKALKIEECDEERGVARIHMEWLINRLEEHQRGILCIFCGKYDCAQNNQPFCRPTLPDAD